MINDTGYTLLTRKIAEIISGAETINGSMTMEYHDRVCEELRKVGVTMIQLAEDGDRVPATDKKGRTFVEVAIYPFVEQIADEDGEPMDGDWCNASGGEWSDEFGDDLDDYPDEMFRKGWLVTSWVQDRQGDIKAVDEEEFADYDTAIARARELAERYCVDIDHRY